LNEAPLATIVGSNTGLFSPQGVAVDASGLIYAVNDSPIGASPPSVTVYAANPSGTLNEAPLGTITGANTGLGNPNGIAVDSSGNIYVANANLFTTVGHASTVTVYPANPRGTLNEAPIATITEPFQDITDADGAADKGVALDACGNVYVTDYTNSGDFVSVYAANPRGAVSGPPLATMTVNYPVLFGPVVSAVAVDPNGLIYAALGIDADDGAISVYPANPSGTFAGTPVGTIAGSSTGLGALPFVAVDPAGPIYSTSFEGTVINAITVYAANPRGTLNEAPIGTITGSNTGLGFPSGIAVH